jgi:predicted acetyltransferase
MPASRLVRPSAEFKESFLEALREYHEESHYLFYDYNYVAGNFEKFINDLATEKGTPHKEYQDWAEPVPETVLWLVKDGHYIGTVEIRHRLNWHLEKLGGNIHFTIRPSMRGRGFGKKILQKALPYAANLGMDKALITVSPDNSAANRIVEFAGGKFEDETPETGRFPARYRYWIDCT